MARLRTTLKDCIVDKNFSVKQMKSALVAVQDKISEPVRSVNEVEVTVL
jgi:hypothetical protein